MITHLNDIILISLSSLACLITFILLIILFFKKGHRFFGDYENHKSCHVFILFFAIVGMILIPKINNFPNSYVPLVMQVFVTIAIIFSVATNIRYQIKKLVSDRILRFSLYFIQTVFIIVVLTNLSVTTATTFFYKTDVLNNRIGLLDTSLQQSMCSLPKINKAGKFLYLCINDAGLPTQLFYYDKLRLPISVYSLLTRAEVQRYQKVNPSLWSVGVWDTLKNKKWPVRVARLQEKYLPEQLSPKAAVKRFNEELRQEYQKYITEKAKKSRSKVAK